ncbi:GNAT family N-acetyltransferase [Streptomyces sp. A2-16]|uniref:GNAT family N-acetyltransferase n=1 Tax=Streptomyces sp. A2-16 TaxID=2781734 RepID=UPI001BB08CF0|nr:N-acetyltransferase [Streptomyces sp. A2-16]QUC56573.1 GNAT family N-acetyltransferase [Streptomyces sp. A2-16]
MDILIRPAEPTDYDLLGEITAQAYLQDGLLAFGDEDDWYFRELKNVAERAAEADVLVAAADHDRILGGVTYVPSGGPLAELARPGEAEIRMLAVAHEARGQGVGQALVQACIDRASAAGTGTGLVLCTQPTMHTAHRLYERLGFTRAPERDWHPIPGDDFTLLTYKLTL